MPSFDMAVISPPPRLYRQNQMSADNLAQVNLMFFLFFFSRLLNLVL
jgi:hypothetical protein